MWSISMPLIPASSFILLLSKLSIFIIIQTEQHKFELGLSFLLIGRVVSRNCLLILTNGILKYNRLNLKQMRLTKLIAFTFILVTTYCFYAKNCKAFNPNNFALCSVCLPNFYPADGRCTLCSAAQITVPQCPATNLNSEEKEKQKQKGGSSSGVVSLNNSNSSSSSSNATNAINSSNSSTNAPSSSNQTITNTSAPTSSNNTNNNTQNITSNNTNNSSQQEVKPSKSSNLQSIIFKYLPPHCCQFKILSGIVCSACQPNFVLTSNNTCEAVKNDNAQKTLSSLLVSSSLPTDQEAVPPFITPFIPLIPKPSLPQVAFIPLIPQAKSITEGTNKQQFPLRTVINDPNCQQNNIRFSLNKYVSTQNQRCAICYVGYYFALAKEQCQPNNPLCKTIDNQNNCLSCYMGYALLSGACIIENRKQRQKQKGSVDFQDPNCKRYRDNSTICQTCSTKFYYDFMKQICAQVDPSCKTWHQIDGYCTSCYPGYSSANYSMKCDPDSITTKESPGDIESYRQYCTKFKTKDVCIACAFRTFLSNGICLPVSSLCNGFNAKFGYCTSCYTGYQISDGVCIQIPSNTNPDDPYCANYTQGACLSCNANYYVGKDGVCQLVSSFCNGYDPQNGYCLDCINPYTLVPQTGKCVYLPD